jgi:hypothetical protein
MYFKRPSDKPERSVFDPPERRQEPWQAWSREGHSARGRDRKIEDAHGRGSVPYEPPEGYSSHLEPL